MIETSNTPQWLQRPLDYLGEWSNPMLVRNIRQQLRSKAFLAIFTLILVVCTVGSIMVASTENLSHEGEAAQWLFAVLAMTWAFALFVIQPLLAFRAVIQEKEESTWNLVELTSMGPGKMLRGFLAASLVQSLLFTSALAPFMVMAYFLRGLDFSIIVVTLILIPMISTLATSLAIMLATMGVNKNARTVLQLVVVIGMVSLWISCFQIFGDPPFRELREMVEVFTAAGSRSGPPAFLVWGITLNSWIYALVLCLVFASSMLLFKAGNRSTGPRLVWIGLYINFLLWMAIAIWTGRAYKAFDLDDILFATSVAGFIGVCAGFALGLFSVTESYELSPRQARFISEPPKILRRLVFIFGPGASRGRWAYLALSGIGLLLCGLSYVRALDHQSLPEVSNGDYYEIRNLFFGGWAIFCYGAIFLVLADLLYRGPLKKWFGEAPKRRALVLILALAFTFIPVMIIGLLMDGRFPDRSPWLLFSPAWGTSLLARYWRRSTFYMDLDIRPGFAIFSFVGAWAIGLLVAQATRYKVKTVRVVSKNTKDQG